MVLASLFLLDERKSHGERAGDATDVSKHRGGVEVGKAVYRRLVPFSVFLRPGFGTPLYYFMTDELKSHNRILHSWLDCLRRLDRRRRGASVFLRKMSSKALLYLQHRARNPVGRSFLMLADEVTAAIVNFATALP